MLSRLILSTSFMVLRSSTSTKRQGWLLKWEGAIAATSTSVRWCSGLTGSGRKGPFEVLRLLRTSRKSILSLLKRPYEPRGVEDHGPAGERGVPRRSGPDSRQQGEESQDRQQGPAVGCALQKSDADRDGSRSEDREKEGVVEPAERFRIHDAKLYEHAERKVREKEDQRDVEDQCSLLWLMLWGYSTAPAPTGVSPLPWHAIGASRAGVAGGL